MEIARCGWVASGSGRRREHTWMRARVLTHTLTCACAHSLATLGQRVCAIISGASLRDEHTAGWELQILVA